MSDASKPTGDVGRPGKAVICGIDPGLAVTGYAVVQARGDQMTAVDAGVCRFDESRPLPERLADIERDITGILEEHRPYVVAVEELYAHYAHPRTAILMGHARGVILLAAARLGIEVRSYAATRIKRYLTGNGRATKVQVQRAIQSALGLPALPEPPDVADALAIAMACVGDLRAMSPSELAR
jgi:crossover junction endodeoxyribonuclease RuvC